jgi:solute carrier family 25 phosphate transporter 23/24/25/41
MAAGTAALLLLGAIGGACAQASAHPLDVVRRRMQMQGVGNIVGDKKGGKAPKKIGNMFQGLYSIGKDEGLGVLFRGLGPACLEKVPSTAIGYYIYEGMKVALGVKSV